MKEQLCILLLEDMPTDAELIVDELSLSGLRFSHVVVDNEKDFVESLVQFKPDIVLSDYSLPTFNGMAALKLVKQRYPHIPVIMVTASVNEETAVACMREGAADYVLKDKMKRLGMAVRSVLEKQKMKLEKQQAEQALQESGRYYRALLNQMNENILVVDKNYIITDVNDAFLRQRGFARNEVIGKRCHKIQYGLDVLCSKAGSACPLTNVLQSARAEQFVRQQLNASGDKIWYSISMSPMTNSDGVVDSIIESTTDITKLMRAQEEISMLSTAIEQSPVSVVLTNTNGDIEYVNPYFCTMTGYTREQVLGQNPRILKSGTQEKEFYQDLWETITKGQVWHGEFHNKKKDGSFFWEEATIGPVFNDQGEITHFLAVKEDVTEKKRLSHELGQAQKMEAVGRLAGGVAHDFNNLLTVINGYCEIVLAKIDPQDPLANNIKQIAQAGHKAGSLTAQLLAFSRKQLMQPKVLNTNQVIHDMSKMLKSLIGENISLQFQLQEDLPFIEADPAQLDQIIINLAVNARDAMPDGGVLSIETRTISATDPAVSQKQNKQQQWMCLSVIDTGTGMDEETKQHIFEPFFSTKGKEGAGLGMATVYGIISQNGWNIDLISEPEQGTTIRIYIPASEKAPEKADVWTPDSTLNGDESILLVEDEPGVRSFITGCLQQAGYTIQQAGDGEEALALVQGKEKEIDLLISDVVMPNMGGKKLADTLKKVKPDLKVIFISGYTDETISRSGVLEEETILLQKPFTSQALLMLMRRVLDGGKIENQ